MGDASQVREVLDRLARGAGRKGSKCVRRKTVHSEALGRDVRRCLSYGGALLGGDEDIYEGRGAFLGGAFLGGAGPSKGVRKCIKMRGKKPHRCLEYEDLVGKGGALLGGCGMCPRCGYEMPACPPSVGSGGALLGGRRLPAFQVVSGSGSKAGAKKNPWLKFLRAYREAHTEIKNQRALMQMAGEEYRAMQK